MFGTPEGRVMLVEHEPQWQQAFEEEAEKIESLVGERCRGVELVGSMAVAGLIARPTLDIVAGIDSLESLDGLLEQFVVYGYRARMQRTIRGRLHLVREADGLRYVNLLLVGYGRSVWKSYLLFRDYLRAHPEEARRYARLKALLARQYGSDTKAYGNGKNDYINRVLEKGRAWRLQCLGKPA